MSRVAAEGLVQDAAGAFIEQKIPVGSRWFRCHCPHNYNLHVVVPRRTGGLICSCFSTSALTLRIFVRHFLSCLMRNGLSFRSQTELNSSLHSRRYHCFHTCVRLGVYVGSNAVSSVMITILQRSRGLILAFHSHGQRPRRLRFHYSW